MSNTPLQIEDGAFSIRQLQEHEALLYKSMRLEALQTEPAMFRTSTPAEATLTDADWKERVQHPRAVFVLLENNIPIGMTSILLVDDDVAYLGQSYIKKEFRGKGLAALLYKARMAWAHNLQLKKLTISHRQSNLISKAANQRLGFIYIHSETMNWLDGTVEDVLYYELEL